MKSKLGFSCLLIMVMACSTGKGLSSDTAENETVNTIDPGPKLDPGNPADPGLKPDPGQLPDSGPTPDPGLLSDPGSGKDLDSATGADSDPLLCPGNVGCSCASNSECISGFCVPSGDGLVCGQSCVDDCPNGWTCTLLELSGQDATYLCLSQSTNLCRPCVTHNNCREGGGDPEARCVFFGDTEGSFCGIDCSGQLSCPDGYACDTRIDPETGELFEQCIPNSGVCSCNQMAKLDGASTQCGFGSCEGTRVCSSEGLSSCDATEPSAEICDDQDNDCDGEADEDFLTGGFYVHPEHCGSCGTDCTDQFTNAIGTCGSVNGLPTCVIESCSPGFDQASETECIASLDPPCGTDDAQCEPGVEESQVCGNCGVQTKACSGNCVWGDWSACSDEGECTAGDDEEGGQDCGNCGSQTRYRTCNESCTWNLWNDWSACAGEGSCVAESDENQACGNCGIQSRSCSDSCDWEPWSTCTGEGICAANTVENQEEACGNCGARYRQRTCSDGCIWDPWEEWSACVEGGSCSSGDTDSQEQSCGNCGAQVRDRECADNCLWGPWAVWGSCTGEGICSGGTTETDEQGCGNCGTESRIRSCDETCAWSAWSDWGACGEEGVCEPGSPESESPLGEVPPLREFHHTRN